MVTPALNHKGAQVLDKKTVSEEELQSWKTQLRKEIEELKVEVRAKGEEQDKVLQGQP